MNLPRLLILAALCVGADATRATSWQSEGPDLGVVRDIAIDALQPDTMYAATANGGIWRSSDGGHHWVGLSDDLTGEDWRWVEPDRKQPNTLWAGADSPGTNALWRSLDAGKSWHAVTGPVSGEGGGLMHSTGARIAFAPSRPETIIVPSTNLHARSVDAGKSWIAFRLPNQDGYAAAVDPTDANRIYMGGRGQDRHLAISTDGGKTWAQSGIGLPAKSIRQVLIHPAQPETVRVITGFSELWESRDKGEHFTEMARHGDIGVTDDMDLVLEPGDADALWLVGEAGIFRGNLRDGVWQRRDEGTGGWQAGDIAIDPRNDNHVFAGMGGDGIYRSNDGGDSWSRSSDGLRAGWTEKLYAAPGNGAVFAQMSVGLYRRDAANDWTAMRAPFTRDTKAEPDGLLFDRAQPEVVFGFYGRDLWRSTDGGRNWVTALAKQKEPSMREMMKGITSYPRPDFQCLAQDAGNTNTMYAGGGNDDPGEAVFKSVDGGANWKPAGQGLAAEDIDFIVSTAPNVVFALSREEKLYRSDDAATTWSSVGSGLPGDDVHALVTDPTTPTRLFVASETGLFRSNDNGATFTRISSGLKDDDIATVLVMSDGRVLVGAFQGVFISSDGGTSFKPLDAAAPISDVRALAIGGDPARLYVGTAVASVWSTAVP